MQCDSILLHSQLCNSTLGVLVLHALSPPAQGDIILISMGSWRAYLCYRDQQAYKGIDAQGVSPPFEVILRLNTTRRFCTVEFPFVLPLFFSSSCSSSSSSSRSSNIIILHSGCSFYRENNSSELFGGILRTTMHNSERMGNITLGDQRTNLPIKYTTSPRRRNGTHSSNIKVVK